MIQTNISMALRKDDTHKSRSVDNNNNNSTNSSNTHTSSDDNITSAPAVSGRARCGYNLMKHNIP